MPHGNRIPFEGVLNCWNDDHDLPDLLLAISRSGKTGQLHFSNPEGDKTLDLQSGRIVFAESSSQDDGLGQYLLRTGQISLMDYTRVSKLVQPGKRLGALLVEENVLEASELVPAVVGQVRSIILGLFRRTETWYRFKEGELPANESITLDLAVPELILEGVRYVESWRRISKGVGSLDSVYQQAGAREAEWKSSRLDDGVQELIDMLASPTSLADICTRATLPDFEACRYLWAFRALEWIDFVEGSVSDRTLETAATPESAARTPVAEEIAAAADPSVTSPAHVAMTQGSPDTGVATDPPEEAVAETPPPPPIPQRLVETQVSIPRPQVPPAAAFPDAPEETKESGADVGDVDVNGPATLPPSTAPTPKAVPQHLVQTQLSVDPPPTTPPATAPKPAPEELMHTQMFVEPPETGGDAPTTNETDAERAPSSMATDVPRTTGEFMESILEGDDPTPARAKPLPPSSASAPSTPSLASTPPTPSTPPPTSPTTSPNEAATQFFAGSNALEPPAPAGLDSQSAKAEDAEGASPQPSAPPPSNQTTSQAPSGFEALAVENGPGAPGPPTASLPSPASPASPSLEPPTPPQAPPPVDATPATPSGPPASAADTPTLPSISPPFEMASFSDLALPDEPFGGTTDDDVSQEESVPGSNAFLSTPDENASPPALSEPPTTAPPSAPPTPATSSPPPSEPPSLPMVEADVVTTQPSPHSPEGKTSFPDGNPVTPVEPVEPVEPPFVVDEPLLPRSPVAPVTGESLTPPRRRNDDVDIDTDGFGHVLGNDEK